jgi:UDP-3-O-[3-hydroxymyristoyl] glucosamine N-acyltransferase
MKFTALQIADILQGQVEGNPSVEVHKLSKIEEGTEGALTFLSNPKYSNYIYSTNASITIVNRSFVVEQDVKCTIIRVDDAYESFSKLLEYYNQVKLMKSGVEEHTIISESAQYGKNLYLGSFSYIGQNVIIGDNVKIYPNTYIGDNVIIGDNTLIFSGVKIYSETEIGAHCIIHSGTIIGSDGFGFAPTKEGGFTKIPQIGNVIIEECVEIGACTTVDRATMGSTIIRKGVKLDNQIQIAHNVEIGENTVIAAQTGVAGSTKIGKNCMIGGQVGISGHLVIGNYVRIQAQSGVGRNIKDHEVLQGSPTFGFSDFNKSYVHFKNLPKIVAEIESLKKQLSNITSHG